MSKAVYKTPSDLSDNGGKIVSQKKKPTWNDGGGEWVYELPDGTFWKVFQPSEYSPKVKISQVKKVVTEVIEFK